MIQRSFSWKSKWSLIVVAIILLSAGLIPTRYLASPKWEVWVVDGTGTPLTGMNVRLSYQNYSKESESHEVTLLTDKNGYVIFPTQYGSALLLQNAFYKASSSMGGVHASFGPHAYVFAFGRGYEGDSVTNGLITDWAGSPAEMKSKITARRVDGQH